MKTIKIVITYIILVICTVDSGAGVVYVPFLGDTSGSASTSMTEDFNGSNDCYSGDTTYQNCENVELFGTVYTVDFKAAEPFTDDGAETYCMQATDGETTYLDVPNVNEAYMSFIFQAAVEPEDLNSMLVVGFDTGANVIFKLLIKGTTTDPLYGSFEGTNPGYTTGSVTATTDWYIQFKYLRDTGASNAEFQYWLSGNGTTWTDTASGSENNADELQLDRVRFYCDDSATNQAHSYGCVKFSATFIEDATCGEDF